MTACQLEDAARVALVRGANRGIGRAVVAVLLLPDDGPTGGFFRDGRTLPWVSVRRRYSRRR